MEKLFVSSEKYLEDTHKQASHFWIPLIGLYTGMRLEEIAQIYVSDVRKAKGVWCIDVNEDKPDKHVKTGARLVPLHPVLVC